MSIGDLKLDRNTMTELMKSAQEMQKKMQWVQQILAATDIIGESGGGVVKLTMNGRYVAKKIHIDPATYREPKEVVEDLIVAAINDATRKVEKVAQEKLMSLSKDMGQPSGYGDQGTTGGSMGGFGGVGEIQK